MTSPSQDSVRAERLIRKHKDAVYRQLYRMCGNHDDAEDVLVESLTKAVLALDGLKTEEAFRAWLIQIARRSCGRLKRRESMHPVLALAILEGKGAEANGNAINPEARLLEREMKSCFERAFRALPEIYAEVYHAREMRGLSASETAQTLGLTVAAVKSRLSRARTMVRAQLDNMLAEDLPAARSKTL